MKAKVLIRPVGKTALRDWQEWAGKFDTVDDCLAHMGRNFPRPPDGAEFGLFVLSGCKGSRWRFKGVIDGNKITDQDSQRGESAGALGEEGKAGQDAA